jgi:serine/threonine protein kinase
LPNPSAAAHFTEQEFYNEISLYSSLKNRYLANLIGVYTTNSKLNEELKLDNDDVDDSASMLTDTTCQPILLPQCMIFEHLNNGDLHEYLIQRASINSSSAVYNGIMTHGSQSNLSAASSSIGGVSSNYLNIQQQQRNIADFLYIGQQIASGMEYLASQNFVLKDLATRNILMSDNLTIKISIDLIAQYKDSYAKDYYKFQNKPLPVRWMSPESLLYGRYTQQSDVWSFGVTLWEIFNYGCQPYSGCTNPEAIEMIRDRQLLLIPDECPQRAYSLMLECWHEQPMQRPTFTEILNKLRNWENYYLFNNAQTVQITNNQNNYQTQLPLPPALPLPLHLQQPQNQQLQMTASYSSNSQNSKASSLLANTASTGISTSSCSPLPPPPSSLPPSLQLNTNSNVYYSPSKSIQNSQYQVQTATNIFASKFQKTSPPSSTIVSNTFISNNNTTSSRIYRDIDPTNSLRISQRTFNNMQQQMQPPYEL